MTFIVYDSLNYANKPISAKLGMTYIYAVGPDIWKDGYESTNVNYIKNTIVPHIKNNVVPSLGDNPPAVLYVDVEENRPFKEGNNFKDSVENYNAILKAFQDALPDTKIGLYSIVPVRNLTPWVNTEAWQQKNDAAAPILKYSDFSMPSLYTFTTNPQDWVKYAIANIIEARQYGKPVIPFLWPQYAEGMGSKTYQFIEPEFWKIQLQTVQKYADGVVLYGLSGSGGTRFTFDATDPWWKVTSEFIQSKPTSGSSTTGGIDLDDPEVGFPPAPEKPRNPGSDASKLHDVVMEAEDMQLGGGYQVENDYSAIASGGENIATYKSLLSTAAGQFTGVTGAYQVYLAGFDQSVGTSRVEVLINNRLVAEVVYDDNSGGATPSRNNFFEEKIGTFYLKKGDEIEIHSMREDGEWSRVDFIGFDKVTGGSSPVPGPSKSHDIVMEAEDMQLGGGYQVENNYSRITSGGENIATYKSYLSTAEGEFTGRSGKYDVYLAGFDQSVGTSRVNVLINNRLAAEVVYDDNSGDATPSRDSFFEEKIGTFNLNPGDEIEIQSVRHDDEWSRVDYLAFDIWS